MIVTCEIQDLVDRIERGPEQGIDALCRELVRRLRDSCERQENKERYERVRSTDTRLGRYPLDNDGFAKSFDPVAEEEAFVEAWARYGVVVGKRVCSAPERVMTVGRMCAIARDLSQKAWNIGRPETYGHIPLDPQGVPFLSRGFFEMYHDDALAQLRQSPRLFVHHTLLWGSARLWTTFDRLGLKLPGHDESYALPLHVDQNPLIHPGFKTVQGVLALVSSPRERGTYVGVPGSKRLFGQYARMAGRGDYVELDTTDPLAKKLEAYAQAFPLRAGDIVSWDSRTTHANTANVSEYPRFVAYLSAGIAREDDQEIVASRKASFETGLGSNVREALMHASKRPRFTDKEMIRAVRKPERLTALGELLYGVRSYEDI